MSTDNVEKYKSNSQRKREAAESFNRQYVLTKTPEYKAKKIAARKRAEAKRTQMILAAYKAGEI